MADPLVVVSVLPIAEVRTGGHRRFVELIRQLDTGGHRVFVVCRPKFAVSLPGTAIPIIPDGIHGSFPPHWLRYWFRVRLHRRKIRRTVRGRVDVVVTFGETNFFAAQSVARMIGAPIVFALRSNFVDEFIQFGTFRKRFRIFPGLQKVFQSWWKRQLERSFTRGADLVVFQSKYDQDNVTERCPQVASKSRIIPNSFRVSWLPESIAEGNSSAELRRVLYLGHLNERKGIQYLLPAFLELDGLVSLDLIGFGGLEEWARSYVIETGMEKSVRFLGRIDMPLEHIRSADLLIVPSLYDSFPNTVLEALFVGTPVIGADADGIRTMLQYDDLLFPRADSSAIARRLRELANNPDLYTHVRTLCRNRRKEFDFDWGAEWAKLFGELQTRRF